MSLAFNAIMFPNLVDVGCFCHTIDNAGKQFDYPDVKLFMKLWNGLLPKSHKAQELFREVIGKSAISCSKTRWWSRWEQQKQIIENWANVITFVEKCVLAKISTKSGTPKKLLAMCNAPKSYELVVQLAAVADLGQHFVKSTYYLEGDGMLCIHVYEYMRILRGLSSNWAHPLLDAVCRDYGDSHAQVLAADNHTVQSLIDLGRNGFLPGLEYLNVKLNGPLKDAMSFFQGCQLFDPKKAATYVVQTVKQYLLYIRFLTQAERDSLLDEWPAYCTAVRDDGLSAEEAEVVASWWSQQRIKLPNWYRAAFKVGLVQPSSAGAERVFSMLKAMKGDRQDRSLEDNIEASLMLRYNRLYRL